MAASALTAAAAALCRRSLRAPAPAAIVAGPCLGSSGLVGARTGVVGTLSSRLYGTIVAGARVHNHPLPTAATIPAIIRRASAGIIVPVCSSKHMQLPAHQLQHRRFESSALKSARVALRKRFGQHLLKNADVVKTIVAAAGVQPHEAVFEIGPGTGNMTVQLLEVARVVYAVELDTRMAAAVRSRVDGLGLSHKFRCVNEDFLKVPLPRFDALVANIPYQISSPVLTRLFAHRPLPRVAVIMFQKEFADRMVARPGSADYCRLSVNSQLLSSSVRMVCKIDRNQFRPPPKVDSAVVEIVPREPPLGLDFPSWDNFLRLVFSGKNKTLRAVFVNKNAVARLLALRRSVIADVGETAPQGAQDLGASTATESGASVDGGKKDGVDTVESDDVANSSDDTDVTDQSVAGSDDTHGSHADSVDGTEVRSGRPTPRSQAQSQSSRTSEGPVHTACLAGARHNLEAALTACGTSDKRANSMSIDELMATFKALEARGWRFAGMPKSETSSSSSDTTVTSV